MIGDVLTLAAVAVFIITALVLGLGGGDDQ